MNTYKNTSRSKNRRKNKKGDQTPSYIVGTKKTKKSSAPTLQHKSRHGKKVLLPMSEVRKKKPSFLKKTNKRKKPSISVVKKIDKDVVRIIPLGGVEEVGKNMYVIEYGEDIIILDAGFQFSDESVPGIDYIIPNITYLQENKDRIKALIVTHGHLDHIGAIPYIMDKIGNPPIYSRKFTTFMIKKRQVEFPNAPKLKLHEVEKNDVIILGKLKVSFFAVTHTIPDSFGVIIETPYGVVVNPGDYKLDHENGVPTKEEEDNYKIFDKKNVLALLADSTNIENPGFSTPERYVSRDLDKIIKGVSGRLIIGTFASQVERMLKIIESAEKHNKKILIEGRSMKDNIAIVKELGLLKVKRGTIINQEEAKKYPENKIVVLATGAQGDTYAALMRMSTGEHKLKLSERDTVLLSSSVIPGNETSVQKLKDNLARRGVKIVHYRTSDLFVHSTGHGNYGELEWLHKKIKPKFFIPIHGNHYMLRLHAELAYSIGMRKDHVVIPDNGSIIEIYDKGTKIRKLKDKASESSNMVVDGFSIGDIKDVVIRDRQLLSEDGIFIIVATINARTGKLRKSPDIISRGFVYLRESQELLQQTRLIIKKVVESSTTNMYPINFDLIKAEVTDNVRKFLLQQTDKKPLVIPVILAV